MNRTLDRMIGRAHTVCVLGHVNPDGDCVGSALAIYNYILKKDSSKKVTVYLDEPSEKFSFLPGFDRIVTGNEVVKHYDLCIVADCADPQRIGKFIDYLRNARESFLIDHHYSNKGFCDSHVIESGASSTCEVFYGLMNKALLDEKTAICIYNGIIHDTGVFKYNCTSPRTMRIAGECMKFGFDWGWIIDETFYSMTISQKRLLGRVYEGMKTEFGGQFVYAVLTKKLMNEYGLHSGKDTDGFIDNIRTTEGAVCAAFFYELPDGNYKGSLRSSTDQVNVAEIAMQFDGGGHVRASGCTVGKDVNGAITKITQMIGKMLETK